MRAGDLGPSVNTCSGHKICPETQKSVSEYFQKHFVSAKNVSPFARRRKHHEQQCVPVCYRLKTGQNAGKHTTTAKRGKIYNHCQARENMQPLPSAGKHKTTAKRGKTCNHCQARENIQPLPSAGKYTTTAKRGKTCNHCQARENIKPLPSAGKHATGAKRGKTCNHCQARENIQPLPSTTNCR